jgi:rubrerythrin
MACLENSCTKCDFVELTNIPRNECPECDARVVTFSDEELDFEENDNE